jgi:exosortase/archaeosortase family protein
LELKKQILSFQKQNKNNPNYKILIFLIKFFAIFFILSTIIEAMDLTFLTNFLAFITANYMGLAYKASIIFAQNHTFIVSNSCTGLVSASILASVIFALNRPKLPQKIKLFIFGALLLLVINVFRIFLILFSAEIGILDPDFVHTITWFLMSGLILIIWYYGTKKLAKIKDFSELIL